MASIFYSMAGEGRGHAVRARTLVERLRQQHEVTLFASDQAFDFLKPHYRVPGSDVRLLRIPGLRFHYSGNRLDLWKSLKSGGHYVFRHLRKIVRAMSRRIEAEQPDLILTDFEPALPRAAERCGVPYISIDHQHFLTAYELPCLPARLASAARIMGQVVQWYYWRQSQTIISSFFSPPLRPHWRHARQVGPLLRPEILEAESVPGEHILSYLRSSTPPQVLEALASTGLPVKVYGLGERPREGRLEFCAIHEQAFVRDLASSKAVISAAGNQLLGESLYLGKPVFAMPEGDHHEQLINAHFIRWQGVGDFSLLEDIRSSQLQRFLARLAEFQPALQQTAGQLNGTETTLDIIRRSLPLPPNVPALSQ